MAPVSEERTAETKKLKTKAKASLALLVIALISISTATYAWFSLSNSTSVQSMMVEVSTGVTLKAYAGDYTHIKDPTKYFSVIKSEGTTPFKTGEIITDALPAPLTSLTEVKLWPVTSGNGATLYTQGLNAGAVNTGSGPEKKYYLQLTLTFISDTDMDVYLNGAPSAPAAPDETLVAPVDSGIAADVSAVEALRISFESGTDGTGVIYEPGKLLGGDTTLKGNALKDLTNMGVGGSIQSTFTDLGDNTGRHKNNVGGTESPVLFSLKKNEPKLVTIRMWVEGEDAQCVNNAVTNIEKAKMDVRLRFSGAAADGSFIETPN